MRSDRTSTAAEKDESSKAGPDFNTLVTFLSDPKHYSDAPARIEVRNTHQSRVFLTGRYAFKLKKAVCTSYLNYLTLSARRVHCEAEVRLNRRLAPSIYLRVLPVCRTPGGELRIGEPGEPVDWLIQMRRLQDRYLLDRALSRSLVNLSILRPVIQLLADFYRTAARVEMSGTEYSTRLHQEIHRNALSLWERCDGPRQKAVDRIAALLHGFVDNETQLLADRALRIVEGHGDLRPEHIYFGAPPAIIDCIEFSRDFRINDPLSEIAFLDMECRKRRNERIGAAFIRAYCDCLKDTAPERLISFYRALSAIMRARLTLWHTDDDPGSAEKWRDLADEYLLIANAEVAGLD